MKAAAACLVMALLLGSSPARAQDPALLYFGGTLRDDGGQPFPGPVDLWVGLYTQEEGGEAVWEELHEQVPLDARGGFGLYLGAQHELGPELFTGPLMWLALRVDEHPEMQPRQRVAGVPYALHAQHATSVQGLVPADIALKEELHTHDGTAWTNRNDGAHSGLDADVVDGMEAEDLLAEAATRSVAAVDQAGYLLTEDLAAVAVSGQYEDIAGTPSLADYVTAAQCVAAVQESELFPTFEECVTAAAGSGRFVLLGEDGALAGPLDAGGAPIHNLVVDPSEHAPEAPADGQLWYDPARRELYVWDGLQWHAPGAGAAGLPSDGLDEVSNGVLSTELEARYASADLPGDVLDDFAGGTTVSLEVAVSEPARWIEVTVLVEHAAPDELLVELTTPWEEVLVLHDQGPGDESGLARVYPVNAAPADGDLDALRGRDLSGTWTLRVEDQVYSHQGASAVVGQVLGFELALGFLSSDRVAVAGGIDATGAIRTEGDIASSGEVSGQQMSAEQGTFDQLTVGGQDLAARLASLEDRLWCSEHCHPAMFDDCRVHGCDPEGETCPSEGPLADGTGCDQHRGRCVEGECCPLLGCDSVGYPECGIYDDGCGGTIACGPGCAAEQVCLVGRCCTPEEEVCDGQDNDCDGEVDEGILSCCPVVRNINNTGLDIEMCTVVPQGGSATYWMGCQEELNGDEWDCQGYDLPQHEVTFDCGFEMMRTEVTVAQYKACVEAGHPGCVAATICDSGSPNYDEAGSEDHPIVCVSWEMARAFSEWVGMRLPTESEWEYSARGPMASADDYSVFPWGTDALDCDHAVYDQCGGDEQDVCSRSPAGDSPFGLCDLSGNVWEWVQDCWHGDYDAAGGAPTDGSAWEDDCSGSYRVERGGSWISGSWHRYARYCRAARRSGGSPGNRCRNLGFRVSRSIP